MANTFENAISKGASIETATKAADVASLSGIIDAVPISIFLGRLDKATGGSVKELIVDTIRGGTEEGLKAGLQKVMQNAIANNLVVYDPERDTLSGVLDDSINGFGVGALRTFLGAVSGMNSRSRP